MTAEQRKKNPHEKDETGVKYVQSDQGEARGRGEKKICGKQMTEDIAMPRCVAPLNQNKCIQIKESDFIPAAPEWLVQGRTSLCLSFSRNASVD